MRLALALAIAATATALALAAPAAAEPGVYEHVSLPPGTDGWAPQWLAHGGYVGVGDGIASGQGLRLSYWARNPFDPGDSAEWTYTAPPGTEIAAWSAERELTGLGGGDWQAIVWVLEDGGARPFVPLVPAGDRPWEAARLAGLHAHQVIVRLNCGGPHACWRAGPAAELGVRSAVAVLRDDAAPVAGPPRGDLAELGLLAGTVRLSVAAADTGGGLLRALIDVDGVDVGAAPVAGGPACRDLAAPGGVHRFAARVPCPVRATVEAGLDTTRLADGPHAIRVRVEDAAGNRTTIFGPSTRTVANRTPSPAAAAPPLAPPPPAPPLAAPDQPRPTLLAAPARRLRVRAWLPWHGVQATTRTTAYGRAIPVRGAVTDPAGRPAPGELVNLLERVAGGPRSARWRATALARTRADGRFTVHAPVGPSRRLVLTVAGGRSRALALRVRAAVRLRAVRRGRWLRVSGRLGGGHVPATGALVTVQARSRGRWLALTTLRTRRDGRFRGRVVAGAPVRVLAPRQPGYPFAAGASPVRRAGPRGQAL
jgi:hypothetical protein